MRVQLERATENNIVSNAPYKLVNILLSKDDLGAFLNYHLEVLMDQSKDPILRNKPDRYINNLFQNKLGDFDKRYIIGVEDEDLVGILIGIEKADGLHITTVGTHPNYRRKGIGKLMLEKCRKDLQVKGINCMYLDVDEENTPALTLYKKLEFKNRI